MVETVDVTITLTQQNVEKVKRLAAIQNITKSDLLNRAVEAEEFLEEFKGRILVEHEDGTVKRVFFK